MISFDLSITRGDFVAEYSGTLTSGITALFGPSGSGKTTFLHLLCGLIQPNSGTLSVFDRELVNSKDKLFVPAHKRSIGVVFQDFRLFPHMSVEKNLRYGCKGNCEVEYFEKVVTMLDLSALLRSMPNRLSGGQKQRVGLGRALLMSPSILILDEPFSALDAGLRYQLLPYLKKVQKESKIPMIVVSHELPDLLKLTKELAIIKDGKFIGIGSLHDLARDKENYKILKHSHVTNNFSLTLKNVTEFGSFFTTLIKDDNGFKKRIPCKVQISSEDISFEEGKEVVVSISPSAISLSKSKVCGISTVNQLSGVLREYVDNGSNILCIMDIGVEIFVEISYEAFYTLDIENSKGMIIYSLFKANSVHVM